MIIQAQLKKLFPRAKPAIVAAIVANWGEAEKRGIADSLTRTQDFLAMMGVESGELTVLEENLNYTTIAQLRKTWPKRFKSDAAAKPYLRNPKALANLVYNGRMGNRRNSDDGWNYRGGGLMQTTGREGYEKVGFKVGMDLVGNPDLLRDPKTAFIVACIEWDQRGCNALSDKGDLRALRKSINGGYIGMDEFLKLRVRAQKAIVTSWPRAPDTPIEIVDTVIRHPAPAPTPAPAPVAPVEDTKDAIKRMQQDLWRLGYTEVGGADGKMGKMTRSAILAFKDENGLPLTPEADDEFLLALSKAPMRALAVGRMTATTKQVSTIVPEAKAMNNVSLVAKATAGIGAATTLVTGVSERLDDASTMLNPVSMILGSIPGWVLPAAIVIVAGAIWWQTHKAQKSTVEAFKTGARR